MEGSSNGDGKTREHLGKYKKDFYLTIPTVVLSHFFHADSTPETPAVVTPSAIPPPRREQRIVCVDPSWQEEAVMDGKIVFGVNPYREICTLHLAGNMLIDKVSKKGFFCHCY